MKLLIRVRLQTLQLFTLLELCLAGTISLPTTDSEVGSIPVEYTSAPWTVNGFDNSQLSNSQPPTLQAVQLGYPSAREDTVFLAPSSPGLSPAAPLPAQLATSNAAVISSSTSGQAGCECAEAGDAGPPSSALQDCSVSKVKIRQDHQTGSGIPLSAVTALYGGNAVNVLQRRMVTLTEVAATSFMCLDDRLTEPSLVTPGGDLGEFILAISSYLQEQNAPKNSSLSQDAVDAILLMYVKALPASRPFVHCTDERAVSHLEAAIPIENLDLRSPPAHVQQAGLLQKLIEVENQGDSHIRLMLKEPEWFQLSEFLVPAVLKSFYRLLWQQNQDPTSSLYQQQKLKLQVLSGVSSPEAFFEVTSANLCPGKGFAPMLVPRHEGRSLLVSHLDAVSLRRKELAAFFARIANATPQKINQERLHQRLDRHGWLALETTGSRIAAGLPFYTLTYT